MPIGLYDTNEERAQDLVQDDDLDDAETSNPFSLTARAQMFCDMVISLTAGNARTLTPDEFEQVMCAYDELENFERYSVAIEMRRSGYNWIATLDDRADRFDDEIGGYDLYCRISSDSGTP
jgi:hypothetical protein